MPRKDFTQNAFDVFKQATREEPRQPAPAPEPETKTAPKVNKGAAKKPAKKKIKLGKIVLTT